MDTLTSDQSLENVEFQLVEEQSIQCACILEQEVILRHVVSAGYPSDEAATEDQIKMRQKEAPDLFVGCYRDNKLLGFICGTRYYGPSLLEESMKKHLQYGDCVCIHSVCVDRSERRKGLASKLLKYYTQHVRETQKGVAKMLLITKAGLIPLYSRAGFYLVGKSKIIHGRDAWYEMAMNVQNDAFPGR